MSENDTEDQEWSMDEIEETLMEMNESVTSDQIDEATLSGNIGYHIFAEVDEDDPLSGFSKTMHAAFDRAVQELFLDDHIVEDYHGEVTPQTVCATVEGQLDDFMGHGGLQEAFLVALGREMGVEPDLMSGGKMFTDDEAPPAF